MPRRPFMRIATALVASALAVASTAVAAELQDGPALLPEELRKDNPGQKAQAPPLNRDLLFGGYYVTGEVLLPGKQPSTGKETVLDALQCAGGLLATAEPRDIRLIRPGLDGEPPRIFAVDLDAILKRGDARTNHRIVSGDRLVIGRNGVVK